MKRVKSRFHYFNSSALRYATLSMIFLFGGLGVLCLAAGNRTDIDQFLQAGNELYSKANYKAAIEQYQRIVDVGIANEVVFYNLGNAYFKDNQLGKAILSYEKARRLAPRDHDIAENLGLAKARIADKVEPAHEFFLVRQLTRFRFFLPLDLETLLVGILFVLANGTFSVYLLGKREGTRRAAFVSSLLLLSLFALSAASHGFRIYEFRTSQAGVILAEKVDVLSGPGGDNPTLFSIHEGLGVSIREVAGEWVQIRIENGWNGWVKREVLGEI